MSHSTGSRALLISGPANWKSIIRRDGNTWLLHFPMIFSNLILYMFLPSVTAHRAAAPLTAPVGRSTAYFQLTRRDATCHDVNNCLNSILSICLSPTFHSIDLIHTAIVANRCSAIYDAMIPCAIPQTLPLSVYSEFPFENRGEMQIAPKILKS